MNAMNDRDRRAFEIMLIIVTVGMTALLYRMGGYKMVVLNLFYLPIVLSGYFLGRTSAGVLALLSVLAVSVTASLDSTGFAAYRTPVLVGLSLTVWGSTLGLTAILVGTLCDERSKTVEELHVAYVGVVEVLSAYLQSANPKVKARSTRVAELSQGVAEAMRLPRKQIDDIRVGALLFDLGNVEITTQLLNRAVDTLEAKAVRSNTHTFSGVELVHSLGSVLSGAMPLMLNQDDAIRACVAADSGAASGEVPLGAKIIRAARAYDGLVFNESDTSLSPTEALQELGKDISGDFDPDVLSGLGRFLGLTGKSARLDPSSAKGGAPPNVRPIAHV